MPADPPRTWWELDGLVFDHAVVADSARLHQAAWQSLFDSFLAGWSAQHHRQVRGFEADRDYERHLHGRPEPEAVAAFLRSRGISLPYGAPDDRPGAATCWGLANRKHDHLSAELDRRGVPVFPDAIELIAAARGAGKKLAVTGSASDMRLAASAGLHDRFDVRVAPRETAAAVEAKAPGGGTAGRDAARSGLTGSGGNGFVLAAQLLGVPPADVVVFSSAVGGVETARAGRFGLVVGVDRDGSADLLAGAGADLILQRLTDLLDAPVAPALARELLSRTFEAVVLHLPERSGTPVPAVAPVLAELAAAGVEVLLVSGQQRAGPPHPAVEVCAEDAAAEAVARLFTRLDARGVGPGLVLVAGWLADLALPPAATRAVRVAVGWSERPPGLAAGVAWVFPGTLSLTSVLDDQLRRRRTARVPSVDDDPAWTLVLHGDDPAQRRAHQTLLTVADTRFGTRGVREEEGAGALPRVLAAGIFDETPDPPVLLEGPIWTGLHLLAPVAPRGDRRTLDLRTGVLMREQPADPVPMRSLRFACITRPGSFLLRAEGGVDQIEAGPPLLAPASDGTFVRHRQGQRSSASTSNQRGGGISAAATQHTSTGGEHRMVERLAAYVADPDGGPGDDRAAGLLAELEKRGFDRLLAEQRAGWAARWRDAHVGIVGAPELQLAVRYNLFHLIGCAPTGGEAAIGARGVAGPGYGGHVFWDADVFVLPFLAASCPPAARAMLEYRIRRLPAARQAAAASRRRGVRFPWESAGDGFDVTPRVLRSATGGLIPVRTGEQEEHIQADVAWAALHYAAWTGDDALLDGPGRPLVLDTARYWASRVRLDAAGRGHIEQVIGPDEYHEDVTDNAFTNVMARWNLRRAAELAEARGDADPVEIRRWRTVADALVDGLDASSGLYEQFDGFFRLEPVVISELADTPVAADLLLGPERVTASQIIKQPDVLMFHHLVPEETAPGSLATNLDFYEPRCAHGSSLSPAIHAALLARAGRPDDALRLFRMAALLDLHNLTGTTSGGLHTATAGGVWQALVFGFAGIRPTHSGLICDPRLPTAWQQLQLTLLYRGRRVQVQAGHEELALTADGPVTVTVPGADPRTLPASGGRWRRGDGWVVTT